MTGLVRKASFLAACGLLVAGVAMAGVPSAINSTIGNGIQLGGLTPGGAADPLVVKTITVRDGSNAIIAGSNVVLNFSTCHSGDIKLGNNQPNHVGNFNCAARTVFALTNASGVATFKITGFNTSVTPALSAACATVVADNQLLGNLLVSTFDLNGSAGVNAADPSVWLGDKNSGTYRERSDFDANGVVNPADGSVLLADKNQAGGITASTAACP
jgi:hypothetical protein